MHLTRRSAVGSGAVLLLAACTSRATRTGPSAVDPDVALRVAAVARERALIALYRDASAPLAGRLAPLLADHEAHLAALEGTRSTPAPTTPATTRTTAPGPPTSLVQLRAAERTAAAAHAADALVASRSLAATLASLAACEASHEVVL